ncbi:MAG: hypothetical protein ACEQSB_05400 [Undibacterium sp.]
MIPANRHRYIPAFTIAEVMLAGFVLTVGIISVMSLFIASQQSARDTRSVIVATNLAQEGIEVARNIRDNNIAYRVLNSCGTNWTGSCDPFNGFPNAMRHLNYNSASFISGGNDWLSYNGSGFLAHGAGSGTFFVRYIKVSHTGASETARVQSFVSWQSSTYDDYQNPVPQLNGGNPTAWCIPSNRCVYTEALLSAWK